MKNKDQQLIEEVYNTVNILQNWFNTATQYTGKQFIEYTIKRILNLIEAKMPDFKQKFLKKFPTKESLSNFLQSNSKQNNPSTNNENPSVLNKESFDFKSGINDVRSGINNLVNELYKKSTFEVICRVLFNILGILAFFGTGGLIAVVAILYFIMQDER